MGESNGNHHAFVEFDDLDAVVAALLARANGDGCRFEAGHTVPRNRGTERRTRTLSIAFIPRRGAGPRGTSALCRQMPRPADRRRSNRGTPPAPTEARIEGQDPLRR